ncbi:hypothetical protein [Streptomyces acidiscabies]|uniref:hypothetical protein n=1 Tax=Streptomyces acidiscabies TaxID=42234 RepID=UPI00095197C6
MEFQEFMVAPVGAPSMAEAVRAGAEIYAVPRARLREVGLSTGLGDEGGFARTWTPRADLRAPGRRHRRRRLRTFPYPGGARTGSSRVAVLRQRRSG